MLLHLKPLLVALLAAAALLEPAECGLGAGLRRFTTKVKTRLAAHKPHRSSAPVYLSSLAQSASGGRQQQQQQQQQHESNTMCLMQRDAKLERNPTVYFFNKQSPAGCNQDIWLQLNVTQTMADSAASYQEVRQNELSILQLLFQSGAYQPNGNTYVIFHGFLASWQSDWMCKLKDAILARQESANVFLVDWSGGSKPDMLLDYGYAVAAVRKVVDLVAVFVRQLYRMSGHQDASSFHLIGHSLGAQISGLTGYLLPNLGRITALDPAGPCFSCKNESAENKAWLSGEIDSNDKRRISAQSAQLVLALHSDTSMFGLAENCAHFDVYLNGGSLQPGCAALNPKDRFEFALKTSIGTLLNPNVACSHSYSHEVLDTFLDQASPSKCYPMAYRCRSWEAYLAGECGFCSGQDGCVFVGVELTPSPPAKPLITQQERPSGEENDDFDAAENDCMFNDEAGAYDNIDDETKKNPGKVNNLFIKMAKKAPTCLYQYQVIVAVDSAAQPTSAPFYLSLPLGQTLISKSKEVRSERVIQVSHLVAQSSQSQPNLARILSEFQLDPAKYQSRYYTAFVTFKSLPASSCSQSGSLKPSDEWSLCWPLGPNESLEVELRSATSDRLGQVQWVAVNYMSGTSKSDRLQNSQLYVPASANSAAATPDGCQTETAAANDEQQANQRCSIKLQHV